MHFEPLTRDNLAALLPHLREIDKTEILLFGYEDLTTWVEQTAERSISSFLVSVDGKPVGAAGAIPGPDGIFISWFTATPEVSTAAGRAALARLVIYCHRDFDYLRPGQPLVAYVSPLRTEADSMIHRLNYRAVEGLTVHGIPFNKWQRDGG
jgi:hypothetical protein